MDRPDVFDALVRINDALPNVENGGRSVRIDLIDLTRYISRLEVALDRLNGWKHVAPTE